GALGAVAVARRACQGHWGSGMSARVIRHVVIRGRVQGVGYRAFAEYTALDHGLAGWVRNRRDGGVEAVLAGPGAAGAPGGEAHPPGPPGARRGPPPPPGGAPHEPSPSRRPPLPPVPPAP